MIRSMIRPMIRSMITSMVNPDAGGDSRLLAFLDGDSQYTKFPVVSLVPGDILKVKFIAPVIYESSELTFFIDSSTGTRGFIAVNSDGTIQRASQFGSLELDGVLVVNMVTIAPTDGLEHEFSVVVNGNCSIDVAGVEFREDRGFMNTPIFDVDITAVSGSRFYPIDDGFGVDPLIVNSLGGNDGTANNFTSDTWRSVSFPVIARNDQIVVVMGDSISNNSNYTLGNNIQSGGAGSIVTLPYTGTHIIGSEGYWTWAFNSQLLRGSRYINVAISGDTTYNMSDRFDVDVMARNPDVVIFLGGTNDAGDSGNFVLQETLDNIESMALKVTNSGGLFIITRVLERSVAQTNIALINAALPTLIDGIDNAFLIEDLPTWAALGFANGTLDGTHPTPLGAQAIAVDWDAAIINQNIPINATPDSLYEVTGTGGGVHGSNTFGIGSSVPDFGTLFSGKTTTTGDGDVTCEIEFGNGNASSNRFALQMNVPFTSAGMVIGDSVSARISVSVPLAAWAEISLFDVRVMGLGGRCVINNTTSGGTDLEPLVDFDIDIPFVVDVTGVTNVLFIEVKRKNTASIVPAIFTFKKYEILKHIIS